MGESDSHKNCMTIVVPVFNRAHLIERCLDSIYSQTWRPLHLIVVDNASTDDTVSVVREWIRTHEAPGFTAQLLSDNRKGAAYARQTGLDNTATERVMFFDSDDAMRPECVASAMQEWSRMPDADVVAWPAAIHFDSGVRVTHSITGNLIERHLVHAILRTQGFAVKTDFLRMAGGWRGAFPAWNDFETGSRILLRSPKVLAIDEPLVDIYPQAESITGVRMCDKAGVWEKSLEAIDESISESGRSDSARLHRLVSYRRAILAATYAKEGRLDLAIPLYNEALSEVTVAKRPLISFAYHWTRFRMRGAFSIIGSMI